MKLKDILPNSPSEYGELEIDGIRHEADKVQKGDLFFCLVGSKSDGHEYASVAEQRGAAAVVCSHAVSVRCPQILCENTRETFALCAAAFYGNPSRKLKMFAVTGTNGKTTTSYILAEILREAGEEVGLIGTNCIRYRGKTLAATLTTPDPVELHSALHDMHENGVTSVVMEVSAHALALDKTAGILYDVAGFTNLSQDHLDYFVTMQAYGEAKAKLFTPSAARCGVVNVDDAFGRKLLASAGIPMVGYGQENPADVFGINLAMSAEGLRYILNMADDIGEVRFALPGRFNMYNTLCAAAMAHAAGIGMQTVLQGIRSLRRVDGRFNIINTSKFSVIIDFAHTEDGLKNIITSVREFASARIITVFGCGGNRDKSKRGLMGGTVAQNSDLTVLTADNPRDENPEDIIDDILQGIPKSRLHTVYKQPDRKAAIRLAFALAEQGDIVLVAGKGAERYQEIKGVKYEYNDEEYIIRLLQDGCEND